MNSKTKFLTATMCGLFILFTQSAFAETAFVCADGNKSIKLKKKPHKKSANVTTIKHDTMVEITKGITTSTGELWSHIRVGRYSGWVSSYDVCVW